MTSSSVADPAKPARRCQGLFLIPIGRENEHQRTIDGLLPAKVSPSAVTSALLPCWGVTDGNYLVKNRVRAQAGDVFALIRAQHKGQAAYVHRLAVVEKIVRDTSACAELYKTSHDYNMGGRKMTSVPFTWIIKFKSVASVTWDKQAFLAKLGIPAHDPILSARPAVMAHRKNAAQAAQVLQECNAVLGLPSNPLPSGSKTPHSCAYQSPMGVVPSPRPHCRPESVPKRLRLELVEFELSLEQEPMLKRKKCMSLLASLHQPTDQVATDPQTDSAHGDAYNSNQQLTDGAFDASISSRLADEVKESAAVTGKHKELAGLSEGPNSHTTAILPANTVPAQSAGPDNSETASHVQRAQLAAANPHFAAQSVPLRAQKASVEPEMSPEDAQANVHQETPADQDENLGVATLDDASNSAALAMTPMMSAQQSVLFELMYHFCAKKGPSWLFM